MAGWARAQRPEDGESGQASLPAPAASTLARNTKAQEEAGGKWSWNRRHAFPSDRLAVPGPVGPHLGGITVTRQELGMRGWFRTLRGAGGLGLRLSVVAPGWRPHSAFRTL